MNAVFLTVALSIAQVPAPGFSAKHGAEEPAYQAWVSGLPNGFRPSHVNVHVLNGKPLFSAIAVQDTQTYIARHNLTAADYQAEFAKQSAAGFRPVSVCGYTVGGVVRYAAIWLLDTPSHWSARHGLSAANYQIEFNRARTRKEVPAFVAGYATPGGHELAAVFLPEDGEAFDARHDLTDAQYQNLFATIGRNGYWPYAASAYNTESGVRFSAVFLKNTNVEYSARHGMTGDDYQREFDRRRQLGFRPWTVSGYVDGGASRFAAVWVRDSLPTSGAVLPQFKAFDDAMLTILGTRGWTGGALAVGRAGRTVLARGYGYRDAGRRTPVLPETPFRVASVTKPFTAAIVRRMIADGKFKIDDKAFALLGLAPSAGGDARLADITVEHLLNHRGGWDKNPPFNYDPMFDSLNIANALMRPAPANARDAVDFMLGKPLQHAPGAERRYSNFGYCVLGRIIERKSGNAYLQELRQRIANPLAMTTVAIGRTRRADRNPVEPEYLATEGSAVNVFDPTGPRIAWPDGGFHLEAMDAHGALIASAPDLARFARAYYVDGRPRTGVEPEANHDGALPGTFTVMAWRAGDVQIVALFNHRGNAADQAAIKDQLFNVARSVAAWP